MNTLVVPGLVEVASVFTGPCPHCSQRLVHVRNLSDPQLCPDALCRVPKVALERIRSIRYSSFMGYHELPATDIIDYYWVCKPCGIIYIAISRDVDLYPQSLNPLPACTHV